MADKEYRARMNLIEALSAIGNNLYVDMTEQARCITYSDTTLLRYAREASDEILECLIAAEEALA